MRNQYKNIKKNQDGAILVIVMMALTVLSLLGLALATASFANIKLTTVDRDYQATYYIAEGGANKRYAEIEELVKSIDLCSSTEASFYSRIEPQFVGTSISDFKKSFTEQPTAKVKVEQLTGGNPRSYQIVSEGIIGKRTRTVTIPFNLEWKSCSSAIEIPDNAVALVKSKIYLSGSVYLSGDIYMDSDADNSVELGWTGKILDGILHVPSTAKDGVLQIPKDYTYKVEVEKANLNWVSYLSLLNSFPEYPSYNYPDNVLIDKNIYDTHYVINNRDLLITHSDSNNYTLDLSEDVQFNRMTFGSDYTLNIDTNNEDHNIVVKDLDLSQGHINIIGGGKVNIYIQDSFNIGGSSTINSAGNTNQLNMYYLGTPSITVSGAQNINGSIFVKKADVKLTGGGGFQGFILSGGNSVVFEGGTYASALVIAPKADLVISGSGSINGTVIANSITGTGGGFIKFNSMNLDDFPFGSSSSPSTGDLIEKDPAVESD